METRRQSLRIMFMLPLVLALFIGLGLAMPKYAQAEIASGRIMVKDDPKKVAFTWNITDDETLVIKMVDMGSWDFSESDGEAPWRPYKRYIKYIDLDVWSPLCLTDDTRKLFAGLSELKEFRSHHLYARDVTTFEGMFEGCKSLETVNFPLSAKATWGAPTSMERMFAGCESLKSVTLPNMCSPSIYIEGLPDPDLAYFQQAKSTKEMFKGCKSLESIDFQKWKLVGVKKADSMFEGCTSLKTITSENGTIGNISPVSANKMFAGCSSLESFNLSTINMARLSDASNMFEDCAALQNVDFKDAKVAALENASKMFAGCSSLGMLDNIATAKLAYIEDTSKMFSGCTALPFVILSGFNSRYLTNVDGMFEGCTSLAMIGASPSFALADDITGWDSIFTGCASLAGEKGTSFANQSPAVASCALFARIDNPAENKPGYFTMSASGGDKQEDASLEDLTEQIEQLKAQLVKTQDALAIASADNKVLKVKRSKGSAVKCAAKASESGSKIVFIASSDKCFKISKAGTITVKKALKKGKIYVFKVKAICGSITKAKTISLKIKAA